MENMLCCLMKTKIMLSNEDHVMLSNEDCATVCCVTKIRMQESPIHSFIELFHYNATVYDAIYVNVEG